MGHSWVDDHPASQQIESISEVFILLVDDDERWARATSRLLTENTEAFTVETAHSFVGALDRFEELDPDCVVCDYQLGDGTGLGVLKTIREMDSGLPFILVTGRGDESVASEAIGLGVTDYIRKGRGNDDNGEVLTRRILSAVRAYRMEHALERERRTKNAMLDTLITTTKRVELTHQFCSQLVEEHEYECAWFGVNEGTDTLVLTASAGQDEYVNDVVRSGYLSDSVVGEPAMLALDRDRTVARSVTSSVVTIVSS